MRSSKAELLIKNSEKLTSLLVSKRRLARGLAGVPLFKIKCAVLMTVSSRRGCSSTFADRNMHALAIF